MAIVHVSSLPPTQCGVAEYTDGLSRALAASPLRLPSMFVRLDHEAPTLQCDKRMMTLNPADATAFIEAARAIDQLGHRPILLQHEFKLYGNNDGDNIVPFLATVRAPVVATLHTVSAALPDNRRRLFAEIVARSTRIIVFSSHSADILHCCYGVPRGRISVIPHGVPDVPFKWPAEVDGGAITARKGIRFITFGLMRPAKGVEHVLAALAELKRFVKDVMYIICGANHPRNAESVHYRRHLVETVTRFGLTNQIRFIDRFLPWPEMIRLIQACDVGMMAYTRPEQSSSGVLALTLACGRPVVATEFQCAIAHLGDGKGLVVPMRDTHALASAMHRIACDEKLRKAMSVKCYDATRPWIWRTVAIEHRKVLETVAESRGS
ncbi:MAG: glycosyltransferase [Phycisphaerae bacterium]|nr:glycosyltransferase [Phycisphaerae bacterium]